jgi:hypothetical protein
LPAARQWSGHSPLADTTISNALTDVAYLVTYLRTGLNTAAFSSGGYGSYTGIRRGNKTPEQIFAEVVQLGRLRLMHG